MQTDLDLTCVSSFHVLMQEQHYGRASAHLAITSPALTKRIQRLERQLQCRLVERGPSGTLVVTDAGMRFAAAAPALLAEAAAARAAVSGAPSTLRMGIPAGSTAGAPILRLFALRRELARSHPYCAVTVVAVPFPHLRTALHDGEVDVLITGPPVWHRATTCHRLAARAARVGLVHARHPLADAGTVAVEDFAALPMLFDPALPQEWMDAFVLHDVRPAREAHLVAVRAIDTRDVMRAVTSGAAVTTTFAPSGRATGPGLRVVELSGLPAEDFHVATRTCDRRTSVQALVELLRRLIGAGTPAADWVRETVPVRNQFLPG